MVSEGTIIARVLQLMDIENTEVPTFPFTNIVAFLSISPYDQMVLYR